MAKKDLGDAAAQAEAKGGRLLDEIRNEPKRLTFNVEGGDHIKFKSEAAALGLTMNQYFYRLWQGK
jgi:hypothetical protein